MNTKALVVILIIGCLFLGRYIYASPENNNFSSQEFLEKDVAIIEPGVLPNSFWYWADRFAEEINFLIKVGKEKKADFLMEIAKERLAEMKKLSEEGINNYADELLTEHEETVTKAQKFYEEVRQEGIERAKELQEDTEREILRKEQVLKKELGNAEQTYLEKQDGFAKRIGSWMRKIVGHLSWKREAIQEQRSEMFDE